MKREETLIQTENVKVRVMELPPGEGTAWHYHTEVTDHMVGLAGRVRVNLRQPEENRELPPGGRCRVDPGRVHQVVNSSAKEAASYLLVQGVGRYDFRQVQPED